MTASRSPHPVGEKITDDSPKRWRPAGLAAAAPRQIELARRQSRRSRASAEPTRASRRTVACRPSRAAHATRSRAVLERIAHARDVRIHRHRLPDPPAPGGRGRTLSGNPPRPHGTDRARAGRGYHPDGDRPQPWAARTRGSARPTRVKDRPRAARRQVSDRSLGKLPASRAVARYRPRPDRPYELHRPERSRQRGGRPRLTVAVLPAKHLAGERHGDPPLGYQRGAVERGDDAARRRKGALHVVQQEDDDVLTDGELTVGKKLEQHRADQRIVGRQY